MPGIKTIPQSQRAGLSALLTRSFPSIWLIPWNISISRHVTCTGPSEAPGQAETRVTSQLWDLLQQISGGCQVESGEAGKEEAGEGLGCAVGIGMMRPQAHRPVTANAMRWSSQVLMVAPRLVAVAHHALRPTPPDRHVQRIQDPFGPQVRGHRPAGRSPGLSSDNQVIQYY